MPTKRDILVRISEAEEKLAALKDEKKMIELRASIKRRRRRRR